MAAPPPIQSVEGAVENKKDPDPSTKMEVDSDHSTDSDLDDGPLNLMAPGSKSMVKMKMEENRRRREDLKAKPKVDALHQAKLLRQREQREAERRRKKKEETRRKIEENKRKRKQMEMERKERGKRPQNGGNNALAAKKNNAKTRKLNQNGKRRTIVAGKENKAPPKGPGAKKAAVKKRVAVVKKPLKPLNVASVQEKNMRKPLTVNNTGNVNGGEGQRAKEREKKRESEENAVEYAVSDYDSDFSDSDLEEGQSGKPIPRWAQKGNPGQKVARQKSIDPDTIFGRMDYKTCDLEILFKDYPSRTKYRQRSASGDWSKDLTSWAEENKYKKDMGWI